MSFVKLGDDESVKTFSLFTYYVIYIEGTKEKMKKEEAIKQGSLVIFGLPNQYVINLWNLLSLNFSGAKNTDNRIQITFN